MAGKPTPPRRPPQATEPRTTPESRTAASTDWETEAPSTGVRVEVKLALLLIVTLGVAFGYLVHRKFDVLRQQAAAAEQGGVETFVPLKSLTVAAKEVDLSAGPPPAQGEPAADDPFSPRADDREPPPAVAPTPPPLLSWEPPQNRRAGPQTDANRQNPPQSANVAVTDSAPEFPVQTEPPTTASADQDLLELFGATPARPPAPIDPTPAVSPPPGEMRVGTVSPRVIYPKVAEEPLAFPDVAEPPAAAVGATPAAPLSAGWTPAGQNREPASEPDRTTPPTDAGSEPLFTPAPTVTRDADPFAPTEVAPRETNADPFARPSPASVPVTESAPPERFRPSVEAQSEPPPPDAGRSVEFIPATSGPSREGGPSAAVPADDLLPPATPASAPEPPPQRTPAPIDDPFGALRVRNEPPSMEPIRTPEPPAVGSQRLLDSIDTAPRINSLPGRLTEPAPIADESPAFTPSNEPAFAPSTPPPFVPAHEPAFAPSIEPLARGTVQYTVRPGDSYWSIAQAQYRAGRYSAALIEHNRTRVPNAERLQPGTRIELPPATELEARYAKLLQSTPGPAGGAGTIATTGQPAGSPGGASPGGRFFVSPDGAPMYRVGAGDTLSGIAQRHLGRASRWEQIARMNVDVAPQPDRLKVGTVLRLPDDASPVVVTPAAELSR